MFHIRNTIFLRSQNISTALCLLTLFTETFKKKYIAERTNKAEIKPEEQNEKAERCRENFWNEIQLKGL